MNWLLLLYNTLLLVVILDATANLIVAYYMSRIQNRTGQRLTWAFIAAASEALGSALTMGASPAPGRIVVWIVVARIATRVFKTWTMVKLALHLLGYINGSRGKPSPPAS